MGNVINLNGIEINFQAAIQLMDYEIREQLHDDLSPCDDQSFFTAYEFAHAEKFNEEWELSKSNPVW